MIEFAVAFAVAVLLLLGSLIALRRNATKDLPSQDVIDRVKVREKEIEAQEQAEQRD